MDLPHVVEDTCQRQSVEVLRSETESDPEIDTQVRDAMNVSVEVLDHILHHFDQYVSGKFPHLIPPA
jgi:hypothetical protein